MNRKTDIVDELFFSRYGMVIGIAKKYAPNADLADDIVQQAYVDFAQGLKKHDWKIDENAGPLLATITKNVAIRHWRDSRKHASAKQRRLDEFLRELTETHLPDPEGIPWQDEIVYLKGCLERLPPKSRELIEQRYFLEVTVQEISELTGAATRTIQQTIRRIRDKLKSCIEFAMKQKKTDREI